MDEGSLIVCDDCGFETRPGARLALDEFFSDKPENVVQLPTGQGIVFIQGSRRREASS